METLRSSVVLSVLVLLFIFSVACAAPWVGSGTEDTPYQIGDANDLAMLAANPSYYADSFILVSDIDLSGRDGMTMIIAGYAEDSNELENCGVNGCGIADFAGVLFAGTFDGNYHVIENLTINTDGGDEDYLGLFGMIGDGGHVKNLGLENASVTVGNYSQYVGTIAGVNGGTIEGCYVAGTIVAGTTNRNIGGMVGVNMGTIQNCHADVNVDVSVGITSQPIGGFIGMNFGMAAHCYSSSSVGESEEAGISHGGFAGDEYSMFSTIINCYYLRLADGGGPNNSIAEELTHVQMGLRDSFANWDFSGDVSDGTDDIWKMRGCPALAWQVPVGLDELGMLSEFWDVSSCTAGQPCSMADWYRDGTIDTQDLGQLIQSWLEPIVVVNLLEPGDDFETGDFSNMAWTMGGDAGWVIDPVDKYEGSYSAKSGAISDGQISSMEFAVDVTGYDVIGFYMKTSTGSADRLYFYDNGDAHGGFYGSGELDWTYFSFNVGSGVHTFKWVYENNSTGSSGSDCVWIDKIEFLDL